MPNILTRLTATIRKSSPDLFCRWLPVVLLWLFSSTVLAGAERNVEERIDEARSTPTPTVQKGNFVFVPIPVANPTVGTGLQVAVLYLHPKDSSDVQSPNTTSGVGAMATNSHSWLVGAFHDTSFANDRYRLNAFAGVGQFNLDFFGTGENSPLTDHPIPYELKGAVGQLSGVARFPGTDHWFVGLVYLYLNPTVTFKTSDLLAGLPDISSDIRSAALGPQLVYDSRNSNYFPTGGQYFRARWLDYAPRWGGDLSYNKADVFYNHYSEPVSNTVMALRARLQTASDNTPFYDQPTLDMRGFARDRYHDNITVSITAEGRHKFAPRWGMVAFVEAGRFAPDFDSLSDGRTITSWGGGVRWQVSAERDMHLGLDFAISTDDRAVFIQVGERF